MTSIILAGGRSSRLGREKHKEVIAGRSLIERVIDRLSLVSTETLIVISQNQLESSFSYLKARTVVDIYSGKGSLGGIYTGLSRSNSYYNLAVACDMPFLNQALIRYMIDLSSGFDVTIPMIGNLYEPLHAIYAKSCLGPIETLLSTDNLKIADFLSSVKVRCIGEDEISRFDPDHLSFFNINTPADMEKAQSLAAQNILEANNQAND